jgi:hypothetical protein
MNWYRKHAQRILEPPVQQLPGIRQKRPGENYGNIGHFWDKEKKRFTGEEGLSLWAWSEETGFYHVDYNEEQHKNVDFSHGAEGAINLPISRNKCLGRYDASTNRCSLVCNYIDPPEELIWKLQKTYGNNVQIVNFTGQNRIF